MKRELDDHQRSTHFQYSRYQLSQIVRTIKLNDYKNLMFNTISFFYWMIEYLIVVPLAKIMSLVYLAFRSILRYRITLWYRRMQSNDDFFFTKIVLIHNANQICNAPYDDRKVNDLCRSFRYLISWWHTRWKFMYRVHGLIVAVCARGHVAFNTNGIYVDDIYQYVWFMTLLRFAPTRFDENPNSDPILWSLVKFTR